MSYYWVVYVFLQDQNVSETSYKIKVLFLKTPLLIISLIVFALFATFACQVKAEKKENTIPVVAVSIPPYISIVKAIAGDALIIHSAIPAGYNPHTSEITIKQIKGLENADLFIGIGEPFEKKIIKAMEGTKKKFAILELNKKLPLLPLSQDSHSKGCCHHHTSSKEAMDHHFWLSPHLLKLQAAIIANALTELVPEKKKLFLENLTLYLNRLDALNLQIATLLAPVQGKAILTSHAALGYFCHDYHLIQLSIEYDGKSPLPQTVNHLIEEAKRIGTECAFTFPGHDNKGTLLIAEKLGLKVYEIDPLDENVLKTIETIANDIFEKP